MNWSFIFCILCDKLINDRDCNSRQKAYSSANKIINFAGISFFFTTSMYIELHCYANYAVCDIREMPGLFLPYIYCQKLGHSQCKNYSIFLHKFRLDFFPCFCFLQLNCVYFLLMSWLCRFFTFTSPCSSTQVICINRWFGYFHNNTIFESGDSDISVAMSRNNKYYGKKVLKKTS